MRALLMVSLVMGLAGCNAASRELEQSKIDLAKLQAKRIAHEWYPRWSLRTPDRECPASVEELVKAVDPNLPASDALDPWGNPFEILCGASRPPGVQGIGVRSSGTDGKRDTPDDVTSWAK